MIGPGFAAAALARDAAILLVIAAIIFAMGMVVGLGTFRLCELLFGAVS